MAYLHSHDNILMDDNLYPKIVDFGLSKFDDGQSVLLSSVGIKGTMLYMSPELLFDNQYFQAGDVYAFSMIAYEIFTNDPPYKDCTIRQLYLKLTKGERPNFNCPIPESYKNLIEKCWSDNGSIDALANYGNFLIDPAFKRTEEEKEEEIAYLKEAVEKGSVRGYLLYGFALDYGRSVPIDKKLSLVYYKKAAENGNRTGMYFYGFRLFVSEYGPVNIFEGHKYLKMAADKGEARAMYLYGKFARNNPQLKVGQDEAYR